HDFLRATDFGEHGEPVIGHGDDALIRFDGAEAIIRRHGLAGFCDGVEERAFAYVGEAYDSCAEHFEFGLERDVDLSENFFDDALAGGGAEAAFPRRHRGARSGDDAMRENFWG